MAHVEDHDEMLRRSGLAKEIFNEHAHTERAGKGIEMLEGRESVLDGAGRPDVVALAKMDDEIAEGNVLGGFKSALDLVHGVDARDFSGVQHVDSRRAGATHFRDRVERGVHGERLKRIGAEPCTKLGHVLAAV